MNNRIGTAQLAAFGWKRTDGGGSKLHAVYTHAKGWTLEHCGHPTANHPYLLRDSRGRIVLTGAKYSKRADFGRAWDSLRHAAEFLADHLAGKAPFTGPYRGERAA